MAKIDIRPVRPGDVEELVAKMRQADVDELHALGITDLAAEIHTGVRRSVLVRTGTADGAVGCLFGVTPAATLFDETGIPWMLGTDLVTRHQRVLMRRCRPYIQDMLRLYPSLTNFVHAENASALRWLRCVGFSLQPAAPFGPHGALFHKFTMGA